MRAPRLRSGQALRWILAVVWIAAFLSGRALMDISAAVSDGAALQQKGATKFLPAASADTDWERDPSPGPRLDVFGNPIDEAMGDYRIDGRGDIYERHAPDTAVLKLSAPGA